MIEGLIEQYPKYHHLVASTQLVLAMLGMGMVMRPRDFLELVLEPKPMVAGMLYQLLGIPLLTVLMIFFIKLPPEIVVGFFMLAAMPGGSSHFCNSPSVFSRRSRVGVIPGML